MAEFIEISSSKEEAAKAAPGGTCACGGHDEDLPLLDVQTIPHAIRHAAIFGALDSIRPGSGIVLSATHNPLPLLAQLQARSPEAFEISYLEEGPDTWKIKFVRN
ncbi:DUF2249 domain-containing protein [Glutamicibacter ectropisis]|uniref:DUF2249 domain-containing protein n=1 Tax=Glutamicibacter ectropisis TaxID=3046593 RepID=A0AAU6WB53_9MICC